MKVKRNVPRLRLQPGMTLGRNYFVVEFLGSGWEGEVYKVEERDTGILRAAKIFYDRPGLRRDQIRRYARKLYKLRHCSIVTQYHHRDVARVAGSALPILVSDFVEGQLLEQYVLRLPKKRLPAGDALHLLHSLAMGVEQIHVAGEYHADIHASNIMVKRRGVGFDVHLIDFFDLGRATKERVQNDVYQLILLFSDLLGDRTVYWKLPEEIRSLMRGRRYDLIAASYRTAGQLRVAIETLEW
jgi:tRNA A-37 threonylcarbamoyl transferase component Bud32